MEKKSMQSHLAFGYKAICSIHIFYLYILI